METNLTRGSAFRNILFFSGPFLFSNLLQTLYGMADLFIVGQYNGSASISGVSIGSQVMHMLTVMVIGLAMGTTVWIGRSVGEGRLSKARKVTGNTILLFAFVSLIFTILLLFLSGSIVKVMLTPAEAVSETALYLKICFAGLPFIAAYNVIGSIFRGFGDSKTPTLFVVAACICNIALDYLFIGGFGMKAAGAALGTVIAQALSVLFALIVIQKRKLISLSKSDLHPDREVLGQIIRTGLPICLQDGFIQISFVVITIIANSRGVDIAAAVGITEKVIGFFFLVPSAMLASVSAISAQCIGTGAFGQATKTLKYGCLIGLVFGILVCILSQFAGSSIIGAFTDEAAVIRFGAQYLSSYSADCIFAAVSFAFSGFFTACGYSMISFIHNVLSIVLVRIPGAWIMSVLFPSSLFWMGLASPAGSLFSAVFCLIVYSYLKSKHRLFDHGRQDAAAVDENSDSQSAEKNLLQSV